MHTSVWLGNRTEWAEVDVSGSHLRVCLLRSDTSDTPEAIRLLALHAFKAALQAFGVMGAEDEASGQGAGVTGSWSSTGPRWGVVGLFSTQGMFCLDLVR
jgi:hypothetical protein